MKKLLTVLSIMLGFATAVSAQSVTAKSTTKTTTAVKPVAAPAKVVTMQKTETKTTAAVKPAIGTANPAPAANAKAVKADGTPDMRYKENKTTKAAPVTGPKKADGTPDMRYKENQKPKAKGKS